MIEIKTVMENGNFLPKNVRQVGEISGEKKIYIEDYVENYLSQCMERGSAGDGVKVFVLAGEIYTYEDKQYIFASGAICPGNIQVEHGKIRFTDETWSEVYEVMKQYFPACEIVGWAVWDDGLLSVTEEAILRTHLDYFARADKILVRLGTWDQDMHIYLLQMGELVGQSGYYVYYVKNEAMQDYMLQGVEAEPEEEELQKEPVDPTVQHFRTLSEERKGEMQQKKVMAFLYTASTFLVMVVFVIGVTMLNNYDKMKSMETTLNQLSESTEVSADNKDVLEAALLPQEDIAEEALKPAEDISLENAALQENPGLEASAAADAQEEAAQTSGSAEAAVSKEEAPADTTGAGNTPPENTPSESASSESTPSESTSSENTPPEGASAAAGQEQEETPAVETGGTAGAEQERPEYYIVQKGDTLAGISRRMYGRPNMVDAICELNQIEDMNDIKYGQKILLP